MVQTRTYAILVLWALYSKRSDHKSILIKQPCAGIQCQADIGRFLQYFSRVSANHVDGLHLKMLLGSIRHGYVDSFAGAHLNKVCKNCAPVVPVNYAVAD